MAAVTAPMAEWDREIAIDAEQVRRVASPRRSWRLLGTGWDCDAWIADESVVWRVPRREVGIAALAREASLMPRLAPRLPAPTPVPFLVEAEGLPALAKHALVPGREMAECPEPGARLGAQLGAFLKALHDPALPAAVGEGLPVDPIGRGDPARRVPATHRRLDQIETMIDVGPLRGIVDAAAGPALPAEVVSHGDLHPRHVLLDERGDLAGVIDWGDSCIGARAVDLAIVTALDARGQAAFFETYGAVEPSTWRHARLVGVLLGAALLVSDPAGPVGRSARGWLERLTYTDH